MNFILDKRLENDTVFLKDHGEFRCLLANDRRFPWLIVVPMFPAVTEIYQLETGTQQALTSFSSQLGQRMMEKFKGDSLNIAAIGNVVNQLHIHHVVRFQIDAAWPAPIWGFGATEPYDPSEKPSRIEQMIECLNF